MTQATANKILEKLNHLENDLSFIKWYVIVGKKSLPKKPKPNLDLVYKKFQDAKGLWEKEWEKEWKELGIV